MKQNKNQNEPWILLVLHLDEIRQQKGISNLKIAELSGIAPAHTSRFFSCKFPPTLPTFFKIAKAIGVDLVVKDNDLNLAMENPISKVIELICRDEKKVMVNATEMAKVFGKRTSDFLRNQSIKEYIFEVEQSLKSVNSNLKMYENRGRSGMYFERRLAIKFATWLDIKFDLSVFETIDSSKI